MPLLFPRCNQVSRYEEISGETRGEVVFFPPDESSSIHMVVGYFKREIFG